MSSDADDGEKTVDVVVVGGGPAGLAAATALARVRRSVLVVDAGRPRNARSAAAHNVLGQDGIRPADLAAAGRAEALGYGARWCAGEVTAARRDGADFVLALGDAGEVRGRRLLLATGLTDELPEVPGVREHWGKDVLHCVYCHGWEVRDRRIGVIGSNGLATHGALMFRQLSDRVILLRHTMPEPEQDLLAQARALGIDVVDQQVERVLGGDRVTGVQLQDGSVRALDAVVVSPFMRANAEIYRMLGGEVSEHPLGTYIESDGMGATAVPGVWAAGNVADLAATIAVSAGAGSTAAGAINADLVMAKARAVVTR